MEKVPCNISSILTETVAVKGPYFLKYSKHTGSFSKNCLSLVALYFESHLTSDWWYDEK